jgi:hypothetical protein
MPKECMQKIRNIVKDNGKVILWLSLFVTAAFWKYGRESAPRVLFAVSFFYILLVYTFMIIPLAAGLLGIKKVKGYLIMAIVLPLLIAAIYQIVYDQNILRIWYGGEFNRQYILGLVLLPGLLFVAGLLLRMLLNKK